MRITASAEPGGRTALATARQALPRYGLLLVGVMLIAGFSIGMPSSFPTATNLNAILTVRTVSAFLALAVLVPYLTGNFDLSVGYGVGLLYVLTISFQVKYGLSWGLVVVLVLIIGAVIGLINGLLVEFGQIDSFIATLGTGTILYAVTLWHTGGAQIAGPLPQSFTELNTYKIFGVHAATVVLIVVCILLWLMLEYLPIGRYMYAVGANRKAAELNGIHAGRYVVSAFVGSGLLTALGGVFLAAELQVGQSDVGLDYLLPAFVGVLLGSTTIHPGRVNVWGTLIAVAVLAIGIAGIQQIGTQFFVEPLFNGLTLVVAVGFAGVMTRRRKRKGRGRGSDPTTPPTDSTRRGPTASGDIETTTLNWPGSPEPSTSSHSPAVD